LQVKNRTAMANVGYVDLFASLTDLCMGI